MDTGDDILPAFVLPVFELWNFLYHQFLENAKGTVTVKYLTLFWNKIFVHLILKMIEF